ncbi:hypothetical protein K7X08_025719 [Anisodus acutangulus]|uniref:Uncharacterized protein n=1 Tax=Anisodus acutangulus TaxID=402998 RepID=A0A9Q1LB43_9SOLA|nr:hypothetical protein K7X08_025719 [Anisodus acutangulus]
MDDYSGDGLGSDAEDGRTTYYDYCEEYGGYDDLGTSQTYDELHQICDSSKSYIYDDSCSDESSDYDDSYGDECADYVEVGSVSPIKPTSEP